MSVTLADDGQSCLTEGKGGEEGSVKRVSLWMARYQDTLKSVGQHLLKAAASLDFLVSRIALCRDSPYLVDPLF